MSSAHVLLSSQLASMSWLLTSIIVKYMDIISRLLARHATGNLIVTDGLCLLGHRVKERIVLTCRYVANYYVYSYMHGYIAS